MHLIFVYFIKHLINFKYFLQVILEKSNNSQVKYTSFTYIPWPDDYKLRNNSESEIKF